MHKIVLHPIEVSSFEDPETATIYLKYEEAEMILPESKLLERVVGKTEEVNKKLRYLVSKQDILSDFISLNRSQLMFEVYPAEILEKIDLSRGVIIKGYGIGEPSVENAK